MEPSVIRAAEESDLAELQSALMSLSRDLGERHRAGADTLERALFGEPPSVWARVAPGDPGILGVALFGPVFSTVRGGAGVFVSDLWVSSAARGRGLGAALLGDVAETADALWEAGFMRLSVHDDNPRAIAFYRDLGFEPARGETVMVLETSSFTGMRRKT